MISRALPVSLMYNYWRLQFYWPGLSPPLIANRSGIQYPRCGKMKDLYNASITSMGTKRLILLISALVLAYAFFGGLEICSIKFKILSSSNAQDSHRGKFSNARTIQS